ncbi:unnamed protein product [Cuscuta campestris]|uniref:Retrotransposon gag domain-containing protein n=1 Tax=Cuscuta campestris TaxID=132261 RepID=A0A484LNB3_9ASTE|nr:unnamed protein product [Cuscuta campestris]
MEGRVESQPRELTHGRLGNVPDWVQQVEAMLERLERKVKEKNDKDKRQLANSPFTASEEECLLFFHSLRGRAAEWFDKLPPGRIDSFNELADKFKAKFQENCTKRKNFAYLSATGQRESKNLTKFLMRWRDEVNKVEEIDDKTMLSLFLSGLRAGELYKEFCKRLPAPTRKPTTWHGNLLKQKISTTQRKKLS